MPTLIIHGDDDQIVPIGAAAMLSSKDHQERAPRGVQQRGSHDFLYAQGSTR